MSTRIRLDNFVGSREEIRDDLNSVALRAAIIDAHEAGDVERVRELQHAYRHRAVMPIGAPAAAANIATRPDLSRTITGRLATWSAIVERRGHDVLPRLRRGCFDEFLRAHPTVKLLVDHEGEAVGTIGHFVNDSVGLRVSAEVDRGELGDVVLRAVDDGELRALSISYDVMSGRELPNTVRGRRVFDVTEAVILEGSLGREPGDPECLVETVGGRTPRWREVDKLEARNAMVAASLRRRPRF